MKLLRDDKYAVERAVIADALAHENARVVADDERAVAIRLGNWFKCVFADISDFHEYAEKYGLYGNVCLLGAPDNAIDIVGAEQCGACYTYAYLDPMPPLPELPRGVEIKRLASSLAGVVFAAYHNRGGGYTEARIAEIMRGKGVFGAIENGKLVGFIGRHSDGSMGMLEVFEQNRGKGIATALEKFLMTYVMTYGRTPFCDVYTDNSASIRLQDKLGLTPSRGRTFWCEVKSDRVH